METAVVGIVGALIGILLTNALRIYFDWRNRSERVRDIQTALQAEIRSQRAALDEFSVEGAGAVAIEAMLGSPDGRFVPFLARPVGSFMFDAILGDIYILPDAVIDPVVLYHRQFRALAALVDDMRSDTFAALPGERKVEIYRDYLEIGAYAQLLADAALGALEGSLRARSDR